MKILLVDDALDMRLVMKRTLTLMGHQVTVAEDGAEAWKYLQNEVFQAVITDWDMPNMDGVELCRHIRLATFPNYVYIILLTGRSGKHNLIAGMDAGADDFATKPMERDEMEVLLRAAERVISLERRLEQQNHDLAKVNESLEKARDETMRDLRHAAALQMGILPVQKQIGPLNFAWFFRPAQMIGGDTFNYFPMNERLQLFYTVDVSGHGISAALLSMYLSNLLTSTADQTCSQWCGDDEVSIKQNLAKMLRFFNEHLLDLTDHYFTMILGVIDTSEHRLHFIQAGHPMPFLVDKSSGNVEELNCTGFPVGLVPDVEYEVMSYPFPPESRLVLFSDGLFEMLDNKGQPLLNSDLDAVLKTSVNSDATETVQSICNHFLVDGYEENQPDDLSVMVIDFKA